MSDDGSKGVDISELLTCGYKGDEPKDIASKCHQWCKLYLAGIWSQIPIEAIIVNRIIGGLTNQLYYCGLAPHLEPIGDEPREVAIKIYGKKHLGVSSDTENERLNDAIIGVILSAKKLSPEIYGVFETGEIAQYYKHHQFDREHQKDPQLVKEVAQKLAKLHSMKVPIIKNDSLLFDMFDNYYENAYKLYPIDELIEECNCETLKNTDLKKEIEWFKTQVDETKSPMVFTHNDFRGSNILVIDDRSADDRVIFCDYEYANYFPRGLDLSSIFIEWDRSLADYFAMNGFPDDSVMEPFICAYLEESAKIYGEAYKDDENNSIEKLIHETKVFMFARFITGCVIFMRMEVDPSSQLAVFADKKQQMALAEMSINSYFQLKSKFIGQ